jgi:microcystin-dependent protein
MSVEIFSRLESEYVPPTELPTSYICRQIRFPDTPYWRATVYELVSRLGFVENWQEVEGAITPGQAANIGATMFHEFYESRCEVIGQIVQHALAVLPSNWLACDGTIYPRADYPLLYDSIASNLIVNDQEFRVPNLHNRIPRGGSPSQQFVGTTGGADTVSLSIAQLPLHNHPTSAANHAFMTHPLSGTTGLRITGVAASGSYVQPLGGTTTGAAGSGQAHPNIPAYTAVYFAIVAR